MLQRTPDARIEKAADRMREIRSLLSDALSSEVELYKELAALKRRARRIAAKRRKAKRIAERLYEFHQRHGAELSDTNIVTVELSGTIEVSKTPPRLVIENVEQAIREIEAAGLKDELTETKVTILKGPTKAALKRDKRLKEKLPSISESSRYFCYVRPTASKQHLVRDPDSTTKWKIVPKSKRDWTVLDDAA